MSQPVSPVASARPLRRAGAPFAAFHQALAGAAEDLPAFDAAAHPRALVAEAQAVWLDRVHTEYRSIQIMAAFLNDVLAAGDPLDVYAGALDLVADEVRHVASCAALCSRLGVVPTLPEPVARPALAAALAQAPPAERALVTGIDMLLVSEAISVGFITDLAGRCTTPAVAHVLQGTLDDEVGHEGFGVAYVRASLRRFPASSRAGWLKRVTLTLAPHRQRVAGVLASVPAARRDLAAWPEPERAALGLYSPVRQALVYRQTEAQLRARLAPLDLWPRDDPGLPA